MYTVLRTADSPSHICTYFSLYSYLSMEKYSQQHSNQHKSRVSRLFLKQITYALCGLKTRGTPSHLRIPQKNPRENSPKNRVPAPPHYAQRCNRILWHNNSWSLTTTTTWIFWMKIWKYDTNIQLGEISHTQKV